ncbi:MAG: phospholipase D-like domain-containing protein [Rhodobacterales bacterium]|nr:phospholipase D-like domain-containing protein [Rhodobacterales bacterium]MDX5413502.1 phospholipase D-like domain-containing protein [Rhodobacterales bacterium]
MTEKRSDVAFTPLMQPGRNCWQIAEAGQFSLIVDAANYFVAARAAMLKAKHSILLIGWDFDARIDLRGGTDDGPEQLGDFILWLADRTPSLEIRLLRWDIGAIKSLFRGRTIFWILRWKQHPRITMRLDSAHPMAASHHQKIVVIDDSLAFCGGIDMTVNRWDKRAHHDHEPARISPAGEDPGPWHDATSAFDGAAARIMGDLARARWKSATGEDLPVCQKNHDCWPDDLEPDFRDTPLALMRTIPTYNDNPGVHEIEAAYLDLIASAKRVIYAESQYFASRRVGIALARRLAEEDGPEIVIINPQSAEGWLEPIVMDTARARLIEALRGVDKHGRFRVYHPRTAGGADIYVHSKITIIDDMYLRVGSSNFNNRSLRLDTECDVILTARNAAERDKITALRNDLVAEHLGVTPEDVAAHVTGSGSLIDAIETLRGEGRSLKPYAFPDTSDTADWVAETELLDPNGPDEMFEPVSKRGLFKGWGKLLRKARRNR